MVGFVLVHAEIGAAEGYIVGEGCWVSVKVIAACE